MPGAVECSNQNLFSLGHTLGLGTELKCFVSCGSNMPRVIQSLSWDMIFS